MDGMRPIERLPSRIVKKYYDVLVSLLGLLVFILGVVVNSLPMFIGGMVMVAIGIFVAIAFRIIFKYL
jgi:uncharacterized membrane protein